MNPLVLEIIRILRQHVGRESIVSARAIARRLRLRPSAERTIRRLLADSLADGTFEELELPVVAVPGAGYFIARDFEEFQSYHTHLAGLVTEARRKLTHFEALAASFGFNLRKPQP